jgi:putative hydrolase of the HAD superfamily
MDDTIFDHSLTCRSALGALRHESETFRGCSLGRLWEEYGRLLEDTHTDVMLGRRTSDEVRTERFMSLAAWCDHPVDRKTAAAFSRRYRAHYQRLRRPVRGAPEFVRRLKGRTQIGIVTNNTVAEQVRKLAFLGLERTVDFLVTSEEIGAAKPNVEIFRAALERGDASPDEAVMVGDRWDGDVTGARDAGIRAVWFNRFHRPRPAPVAVPEFASYRAPRRLEWLLAGRLESE